MTKSKKTARPISEEYCIQLDNHYPTNFSMIPNFLGRLTYDHIDEKTGKKTVKRLSVYARVLYQELISTTGQKGGKCWKNTKTLADDCNFSTGMISKAKKELLQKFHQLEGKSLINLEEKSKSSKKNGSDYHLITVNSVWNYNNIYHLLKENEINLSTTADSQGELVDEARSCGEQAYSEARSCGETNKKTNNNISLSKEQQPTAEAEFVASFKKKDFVSSVEELPQFKFLVKQGFTDKSAKDLVKKYSNDEIKKAADYVVMQINKKKIKGEKIKDLQAYFVNTLKFKYYSKKG